MTANNHTTHAHPARDHVTHHQPAYPGESAVKTEMRRPDPVSDRVGYTDDTVKKSPNDREKQINAIFVFKTPVQFGSQVYEELRFRLPIVRDGFIANKQQDGASGKTFAMMAYCAGVDVDMIWNLDTDLAVEALKKFSDQKDPMYIPKWNGNTLKLYKPLNINGDMIDSVTVDKPSAKDLLNDQSKESMFDLVVRLCGYKHINEIAEMDYLHDYRELVDHIERFRDGWS